MKNKKINILKKTVLYTIIMILITNVALVEGASKNNETLGDLRSYLKTLQAKKEKQNNEKEKTENEIAANKNQMYKAENELEDTKEEIIYIQAEIDNTNKEISKVQEETNEILKLYQKLENENIYISYITGASSMTELVMRLDAINQLANYNQNKIKELELLITTNDKLVKELDNHEIELGNKIEAYDKSIEVLGDELAELVEGAITIDDEIKSVKEQIKQYEQLGCKDDQLLTTCINIVSSKGWLKPVAKGKISSVYGYRKAPTASASTFHRGVDISLAEGTKVYATAPGTVGAIVRKASCGGNMVYVWTYVNGKPYTYVFMHLLEINVEVFQEVTVNTVLGKSGGGSTSITKGGYDKCTSGAHLHYGLASGGFYGSSKSLPLSKFNANTIEPPGYPGKYQWFYHR